MTDSPSWQAAELQWHFASCIRAIGRAPLPAGASAWRRAVTLWALARYAWRGRFPHNPAPGTRHPIFRDARGTPCAVGHLLAAQGHGARVDAVAAHHNFARVPELARAPWVGPTLLALGLTVEEAARVQPSYPGDPSPGPDAIAPYMGTLYAMEQTAGLVRTLAIAASLVVALLWLLPKVRASPGSAERLRGAALTVALGALLAIAAITTLQLS